MILRWHNPTLEFSVSPSTNTPLSSLHVALIASCLVGCAGGDAGPPVDTGAPATGSVDVDALSAVVEAEMAELGVTAMSMAIVQGGVPVWSGGFGTLEPDGTTSVDADTLFRVASVTKPMTALAVLQNVDAGCLDLSDPVNVHMPFEIDVQPEHSDALLVEHTLTHAGGLIDYELQTGQEGDGHIEPFLEEFQAAGGFLAPPGRMYNYSNTNLVVAGRLVELCADRPFRAYMEEEIWSPLGMDRTVFDQASVVEDGNHAAGITSLLEGADGAEQVVGPDAYSAAHLWPAMGAWSSADDLAQLAVFLLEGDLHRRRAEVLHQREDHCGVDGNEQGRIIAGHLGEAAAAGSSGTVDDGVNGQERLRCLRPGFVRVGQADERVFRRRGACKRGEPPSRWRLRSRGLSHLRGRYRAEAPTGDLVSTIPPDSGQFVCRDPGGRTGGGGARGHPPVRRAAAGVRGPGGPAGGDDDGGADGALTTPSRSLRGS